MTVDELREHLGKFPGDMQVVQSKDAEGNGFSPVADVSVGRYEPETTWAGDFEEAHDDLSAVCIWPVN